METSNDSSTGQARPGEHGSDAGKSASQVDDLISAVRRLEAFAMQESQRVSATVVPKLEAQARQNLWTSLLIALGLGVILGLWLGAGRRRG